ncbi:MAG TPA: vitamin K epoxide reductase family protein [Gemmatimonadales bacterium]
MAIAVLCVGGLFVSAYLWMFKLGLMGTIACGGGGCVTVQLSPYSRFLGLDVALIGLLGYLVMLWLALVSLRPRFAAGGWPVRWLALLSGGAFLFSLYLWYIELFVIHAICRWCVASSVFITLVFVLAVLEARRPRQGSA